MVEEALCTSYKAEEETAEQIFCQFKGLAKPTILLREIPASVIRFQSLDSPYLGSIRLDSTA